MVNKRPFRSGDQTCWLIVPTPQWSSTTLKEVSNDNIKDSEKEQDYVDKHVKYYEQRRDKIYEEDDLTKQQHRNVKTGNKGWERKPIGKILLNLCRDSSGGQGEDPPKAARIRHPKIPPLNYAARGEESLRQGVTNKQKFQSTNSVPP
ncbi:hypothetical protein TNCV_4948071 [Trichonephila clavipes]|nr:hypothetical protein TNCV_4948071 [Trichonephila clavipes]